ncbi:hypothetical protein [Puia dinghuensis]|uniref:Uncharacterized protein n=1 Tax=Puia dinghuensis TaxID=1792502 RepID=A0A8J2UIV7_9BACT|nr:hypothetical protein [Puia dinghuensis]GGB23761.1 hypothetical protein GCM10011511_54530 [Puia dinghuensis]
MNSTTDIVTTSQDSYWSFIWKESANRKSLLLGIGLCIIQFVIFKLLYPFPDFFGDSYSYIFAASAHLDISIWPIGYSKFLDWFHAITHSDTALVAFQYFFLQAAALHFYFTIIYFFKVKRVTQTILFLFLFINPLSLYLCNTVNSDALFAALTLLWLIQMIWIVQRPRLYQVLIQAILLFLCFTVRNNAYYYPAVTVIAYLLTKQSWKVKLGGILMPFFFLVPFIIYTEQAAFKITGIRQYSLFTGWQLANNALYIYDRIEQDSLALPTPAAKEVNRLTLSFLKHVNEEEYRSLLETYVGNFFIREPNAPLKRYFGSHYQHLHSEMALTAAWGKASADFEPFGKAVILQHPMAYTWYFIRPNILHYFLPPLSHIERYNYGTNEIDPIARDWFGYPNSTVHCISHSLQGFLIIYEAFFLLFNLYFLWQLAKYLINYKRVHLTSENDRVMWAVAAFLLLNFLFSIVTTVNILRYQVVPMAILLSFGALLNDHLSELVPGKKPHLISKSPIIADQKTNLLQKDI